MLFILLYQCFAGFLAWFNYWLIKNDYFKNYYHSINGALHIVSASLISYQYGWNYGVSCLLFTRVVFDFVLNVLRHLGVGYVSPAPASKVDQVEKWAVLRLSEFLYRKRSFITDENVERVAIYVRIFLLIIGLIFLVL